MLFGYPSARCSGAVLISLVLVVLSSSTWAADNVDSEIPALKRNPCADWINVRAGKKPAVGDGKSDDTAALQAAIDQIGNLAKEGEPGDPKAPRTVYLPAGTYRITDTLKISDAARAKQAMIGVMLIGEGSLTRIVWDGPADPAARMILSDGASSARYDGIVFDGADKAGVGIDHAAARTFETEVGHHWLSFRNLTTAGIRIGTTQVASAEMIYKNCVFTHCESGIQILASNDLDNVITGCEFRQCNRGIVLGYLANGYVRDCHFKGSTATDIIGYNPISPCSIRRCTSIGSKRFLEWSCNVAALMIQDCRIDGWTAPGGAIVLKDGSMPALMFDVALTHPPDNSPPIYDGAEPLMLSNVTAPESPKLLAGSLNEMPNPPAIVVPAGKRGGSLTSATQRFRSAVDLTGKVFDAQRDFGAIGDGMADDTAAVQKTIDAARAHGQRALAYMPPGFYKIKKTLDVTGADYVFGGGGAGTHTRLYWDGAAEPIVHVHDVDRVKIERLSIGVDDGTGRPHINSADILHDGTRPGLMEYESVWVWGTYGHAPEKQGLRVVGLPQGSTVHLTHISGNTRFTDCSRARILVDAAWEGAMTIEGARETIRDGQFGVLTRFNGAEPYGLFVCDNQSVTVTDYYTESSDGYVSLSGSERLPPGRFTLWGVKVHTKNLDDAPTIRIDNYAGQVSIFGTQFWSDGNWNKNPYSIVQKGNAPLDLVLATNSPTAHKAGVQAVLDAKGQLTSIGNFWDVPVDKVTEVGLARIARALDDFRDLGALDLAVNYPAALPGAAKSDAK